jgi:hypothetical protein
VKRAIVLLAASSSLLLGTMAGVGQAAKPQAASCWMDPSTAPVGQDYLVHAAGLPKLTAINIWITEPDGTVIGRPLGTTPDGTFDLWESSDSAGTYEYAFSGPTKPNTKMLADCSMDAY